jgi:predicted nucleotidyltransferase
MNLREAAAMEAHRFFAELGVPYVFIGGTAVQFWGEPRFTADLDLTVATPLEDPAGFIQQVVGHFRPRIDDAVSFARRNRIILVRASNDYPLDIALGLPGYEDILMQRAVVMPIAPGSNVRVCSAEDLIIHKAIAGRPQDLRDIEGVIRRQQGGLDLDYVREWLAAFAGLLDNPDVVERFERAWRSGAATGQA